MLDSGLCIDEAYLPVVEQSEDVIQEQRSMLFGEILLGSYGQALDIAVSFLGTVDCFSKLSTCAVPALGVSSNPNTELH